LRLQAAGAGLGAIGACTEGMHGLKPCPALAAAISELSIAIAFALSTLILLLREGSEWEWLGHVEPFCVYLALRVYVGVTETFAGFGYRHSRKTEGQCLAASPIGQPRATPEAARVICVL